MEGSSLNFIKVHISQDKGHITQVLTFTPKYTDLSHLRSNSRKLYTSIKVNKGCGLQGQSVVKLIVKIGIRIACVCVCKNHALLTK